MWSGLPWKKWLKVFLLLVCISACAQATEQMVVDTPTPEPTPEPTPTPASTATPTATTAPQSTKCLEMSGDEAVSMLNAKGYAFSWLGKSTTISEDDPEIGLRMLMETESASGDSQVMFIGFQFNLSFEYAEYAGETSLNAKTFLYDCGITSDFVDNWIANNGDAVFSEGAHCSSGDGYHICGGYSPDLKLFSMVIRAE